MKPTRSRDAAVDLVDVLLREGVVVEADVVVSVADVALVGIRLRAAIAGMTTMTEYGYFEDWDAASGGDATAVTDATAAPDAAPDATPDAEADANAVAIACRDGARVVEEATSGAAASSLEGTTSTTKDVASSVDDAGSSDEDAE